jgi:hypothetical protein
LGTIQGVQTAVPRGWHQLIDIPQKHYTGKNSADIKMVVDAMDLSASKEHVTIFVIASGTAISHRWFQSSRRTIKT